MSVKAILYFLQIPLTVHSWNCGTDMLKCHISEGFSNFREAVLLPRDEGGLRGERGLARVRANEINARSLLYDTPSYTA